MFTIYHFFFYISFLAFIFVKNRISQNNRYWLLVWMIILISGIRDVNNYTDLPGYFYFYNTGELYEEFIQGNNLNIGYEILNIVFSKCGIHFQFFMFLVGAFIMGVYAWFIAKYSPNKLLSLAIFILINYIFSLVLLRQYLACAVGLLAFDAVVNRKLIKYFVYLVISVSFHTTALVLIPVYFIYGIKMNKINIFLCFGGVVLFIASMNILSAHLSAISEYYAYYLNYESESSLIRSLMKIFIFLLYIYTLKKDVFIKDIRFLILICLMINVILYVGGGQIYGIFRLRAYFELSEILGIPFIWQYAKNIGGNKRAIAMCSCVLYLSLLFVSFTNLLYSPEVVVNSNNFKTCFF